MPDSAEDRGPQTPGATGGRRLGPLGWLVKALAPPGLGWLWVIPFMACWLLLATVIYGNVSQASNILKRKPWVAVAVIATKGMMLGGSVGVFVGPLSIGSARGRSRRLILMSAACGAALGALITAPVAIVVEGAFPVFIGYRKIGYILITNLIVCVAAAGLGGLLGGRLVLPRRRVRFTLRRVMLATAVLGLVLGGLARLDRLQRISAEHQGAADRYQSNESSMRNFAAEAARDARSASAFAADYDKLAVAAFTDEARIAAAAIASLLRKTQRQRRSEVPSYERRLRHFETMSVKYREAAQRPWSPVEPDPPEPPLPVMLPDVTGSIDR